MYYLGWHITYEKYEGKLNFVGRRSCYKPVFDRVPNQLFNRILYKEIELLRMESKDVEYYGESEIAQV
jgi:hypothetical protein